MPAPFADLLRKRPQMTRIHTDGFILVKSVANILEKCGAGFPVGAFRRRESLRSSV